MVAWWRLKVLQNAPLSMLQYFPPALRDNRYFVCLFCCYTSQVNSYGHGRTVSSPNHSFSWASLIKQLTSTLCTYFPLLLTTTLLEWFSGREENDRRNFSWSISMKVWDCARIELGTSGSAVRLASVARYVTDWATCTKPSIICLENHFSVFLRVAVLYRFYCTKVSKISK